MEWLRGDELHLMSLYVRSLNPVSLQGEYVEGVSQQLLVTD